MITDDGVNWQYVENNLTSDISWRKFAFRVTDYVNLTPDVQLKFIASDSANGALSAGSLVEAAVDDLMLYEEAVATSTIHILENPAKLIKITDLLGREVWSSSDYYSIPESKTLIWNGLNTQGERVPSGIYFFIAKGYSDQQSHKITLIK